VHIQTLEDAVNKDLLLTATGAPAAVLGDKRYPLVFTIAGMKEWAEYRGQSFEEVLKEGWQAQDLTGEDLTVLLKIALNGGEMRRRQFTADSPRDITDALVGQILELSHPAELMVVLVTVWNQPPVIAPDPQIQESPRPGE
jgi:hypothetical protein